MAHNKENLLPQIKEAPLFWRVFLVPTALALLSLFLGYLTNFLVFHALAELISIFIGLTALTVAGTTTEFTKNQFIVFISMAVGWVACIDVAHLFVYEGMSLIPHTGGNESTQLWMAARLMLALSFLGSTFFFKHSIRLWVINLCFSILTISLLYAVFTGHFPQTYIEHYGVTRLKMVGEWSVALILSSALALFWYQKNMFSKRILHYLSMALVTMIGSELLLSYYANLYGIENYAGHVLKIFSFWFIYVALVMETLRRPFSALARSASTYDNIPDPTMIIQRQSTIRQVNKATGVFSHTSPELLVGLSSHTLFHDKRLTQTECPVCSRLLSKKEFVEEVEHEPGVWLECSLSPINSVQFPHSWVQVVRDISARKALEVERNRLLFNLSVRVKELKCLYTISNVIAYRNITIEDIFNATVKALPQAFQFPELMAATIESKLGDFYSNPQAEKTNHLLERTLFIENHTPIQMKVYYTALPSTQSALFLPEESALLESVATLLQSALKEIQFEEKATLAESRFKESELHFRAIIEQTGVGVYVRNKERFLYVNPRFCEIVGRSREELLAIGLFELLPDDKAKQYILKKWKQLEKGRASITAHLPIKKKDGNSIMLRIDSTHIFWKGRSEFLGLAQDDTAILKAQEQIEKYVKQLENAIKGIFLAVSKMVELRDPYTAGHEHRVGMIAKKIATKMGWTKERCETLELMGFVHDIGKISIPAEILSKPTQLTPLEMELIKEHPHAGYMILKDIEFNAPIAEAILQHHERMDGSGYPQGLKGEAILPEARVIAVADVFDAMSAHRPYRPTLGLEATIKELSRGRGIQYDAEVVDAFLALIKEKGAP
ncbi:MAG: MASE3 domain-containing protein [Tatlockia sp.]|jgi:PAS domain S-box-containing protein